MHSIIYKASWFGSRISADNIRNCKNKLKMAVFGLDDLTNQTSTSPFKSRYIKEYPKECLQGISSFNFLSCLPKVTRRSWKFSFICFTNMGLSFYFFQSYYKTKGYIWSGSILLHFSLEKFKYFFFFFWGGGGGGGGRGFVNASKLKNGIPKIYLF